MNPIAQILWDAAADVEQRGVLYDPRPYDDRTCAVIALHDAVSRLFGRPGFDNKLLDKATVVALAAVGDSTLHDWNDSQPSQATVAAALRDASFLANWAGDHLLKVEA